MHATIRLCVAHLWTGEADMDHKTCTFFGHRDCPKSIQPELRAMLIKLIEQQNVRMFYVGNQGAFDAMVHTVLQELSIQYPQINYAVVLAYLPQQHGEGGSDSIWPEGLEKISKRSAISWRNHWMLNQADFVVTYITHSWGGAAQFAEAAKKKGKMVYNLSEKK